MHEHDPLANVLYVDLSTRRSWVSRRDDLVREWLGGAGLAAALLHEEVPEGADPMGPDNAIVLAVGPLTGLYPLASKTVAMFKSPHTGNLGESHSGGRSAVAIRMAGYGAIVIKGKSDIPVYLAIHGDEVKFRDASTLWGMGSMFTVGHVLRKREQGSGLRSIMRIGRAGERGVSYACVTSESYRHFGRLGLGAVFGSKLLKAIVVGGKRSLPVVDVREYRRVYDDIYEGAVQSDMMKKYHDLGTSGNVLPLNALGGLPTINLQTGRSKYAEALSGEHLAEHYLGRRLACAHCPVGCIHIAALRTAYQDEAYFYKTEMIGYDYELIFSLGTLLGGTEAKGFLRLLDEVEILGVDAMSTGVVLAWATEAFAKGLVTVKETDGLAPAWGDYPTYVAMLERIVTMPTDFYRALAQGVDHASSIYGGEEFALAFGGNEMPGYHTGPACHIGYTIGARHSHLDNGGYSVDQKVLSKGDLTPAALVDKLVADEEWRQILASLVICFFARKVYSPEITRRALATVGIDVSEDYLVHKGKLIYRNKYAFKLREGFDVRKQRLPGRIFETPSPLGAIDPLYMDAALEHFHELITAP